MNESIRSLMERREFIRTAAVGTVVYYFVDPSAKMSGEASRSTRRMLALVPNVGPTERGLSLVGSF